MVSLSFVFTFFFLALALSTLLTEVHTVSSLDINSHEVLLLSPAANLAFIQRKTDVYQAKC